MRALLRDEFPVVKHLSAGDVPLTVIYGDGVADAVARLAEQSPELD